MVSSSLLDVAVDMDDALPAALAAPRLGVTVAAVKGWARRGIIAPVRTDPRWGRLYRWADLLAAEIDTADSPNRRTRRPRDYI